MRVPFMDLAQQWHQIADEVRPELDHLFERSAFSQGPFAATFETAFADFVGAREAVGVNSGTSALHLAVLAAGIGPGDRVLIPAQTFIATAWAVLYAGAEPVLVDVDAETGTLDAADAEQRLSRPAKAIIPVHLFGQPADMEAVMALADRHGLTVIEDCAQAHGARYRGRLVGTFGQTGCFSFYPGKNLGAAGEAGAITTDDPERAEVMRQMRNHGQQERYVHGRIGYNYRMDGVQGVVLSAKLKRLPAWTDQRRAIAARYGEGLADLGLRCPRVVNDDHVWHLYVVRTPHRDALRAHLDAHGVQTGLHYPVPLNRQPVLAASVAKPDSYPNADDWADQGLSLPLFPGMTDAQVDAVIKAVRDFFTATRGDPS